MQWLCFFFFLAVILPNKTLSKPFELEASREDFADDKLEPNVAYQNNTADVRSKREVKTLRDICNAGHYRISSNGCVKRWLVCYDYQEAECEAVSFKCLSSIPRYGSPKCKPIYDFVKVNLNGATQKFRRTKGCICAWRLQENRDQNKFVHKKILYLFTCVCSEKTLLRVHILYQLIYCFIIVINIMITWILLCFMLNVVITIIAIVIASVIINNNTVIMFL